MRIGLRPAVKSSSMRVMTSRVVRADLIPKPSISLSTPRTGSSTRTASLRKRRHDHRDRGDDPELVHVYEKIKPNIWTFNGVFALLDAWREHSDGRQVFKFKLELVDDPQAQLRDEPQDLEHSRVIPSPVKLEVWKRDKGHCVLCGSTDNLHFDHVLPFSRGGTSLAAKNVQLLCARHNLQKSARIE